MKKLLVVDDEQDLLDILRFNLEAEGYAVDVATSAEEALETGIAGYDLILLDVMMGGMSGFRMAEKVHGDSRTEDIPIIFLTARDTEEDRLRGFHLGGDDYISKPFSIKELIARVKAVISRSGKGHPQSVVTHKDMVVNYEQKSVLINGAVIELTHLEFDILWLLITHRGQVFSRDVLIQNVWPAGVVVSERTVDVNITRLRKKIEPYSQCLRTRHGYGYYFTNEEVY